MSDILEVRLGEPDRRPTSARIAAKAAGLFGHVEPYVRRERVADPPVAEPVQPRAGRRVEAPVVAVTRPDWARGYGEAKPVDGRYRSVREQARYERRTVRAGLPALRVEGAPANRRPVEPVPVAETRPDFVRAWE